MKPAVLRSHSLFLKPLLASVLATASIAALAQTPTPAPTPQPVPQPVPQAAAPSPANMPIPPPPGIEAKSWVLMDYGTGQILASNNPDLRVEPASITKVMTSYVVSAELARGKIKREDMVTISENAWRSGGAGTDGSTSFLALNSQVPLDTLLHGMIIQSGNDAAIALAEHTAGSEPVFADVMNQYAARLGLAGTHYMDASGLPNPEHYTTAADVARLSRALIRDYPEDYAIYAVKDYEWNGIKQHNRNTLLWRDSTVDGIKTGHTSSAGYCLAASAKRGDQRLISVVMGAGSEKRRADDNQALLNYGFRFYESHNLYAANTPLAEPEVWKGEAASVPLGVAEEVAVTMPRGRYADLKANLVVPGRLIAPITKGQPIGTLKVELDGKTLLERPLIALVDVAEGGFFKRISDGVWMWFKGDEAAEPTATPAPAAATPTAPASPQ